MAFRLLDLPAEIVGIVCTCLDEKDICALRLVCRDANTIALRYVFRRVRFSLRPDDFTFLRSLSRHPTISSNVKTLQYTTPILTAPRIAPPSFAESFFPLLLPNSTGPAGQDMIAVLDDALDNYREYRAILDWQSEAYERNWDCWMLQDVMSRLPALRHIDICSTDHRNNGYLVQSLGTELEHGEMGLMIGGQYNRNPKASHHLQAMLRAISKTPGLRLESLAVSVVNWKFFKFESVALTEAQCSLASLTSITLDIGLREIYDYAEWVESWTAGEKCRELMKTGILRNFLASLPRLEHVSIYFDNMQKGIFHTPLLGAYLEDVLATGHRWPRLQSLSLGGIVCERQSLMRVFDIHKDTLKTVLLRNIFLRTTSWMRLLPSMRETLGRGVSVKINGTITGYNEVSRAPEGRCFLRVSRSGLVRSSLDQYFVDGGELPWTDEENEPEILQKILTANRDL